MIENKEIYKIVLDRRLILKCYFGLFSLSDFIACVDENGKDCMTCVVVKNFRERELDHENGEIQEFVEYYKGQSTLYSKRKISFTASTPKQEVLNLILEQFKNGTLMNIKTFSTLSEVTRWFGLPYSDLNAIRDYFTEFKNANS
jgi:hypothetical protein